jgi:LemA protein
MDLAPIIIIVIVVLLVVVAIGIYNGLVQRRLRIDEAFAQIEVQLKRRHDLIPNLVNAGQGLHGASSRKVLTDVTNARANAVAAGSQGPAQQAAAGERADEHAPLALRRRRELPGPQGEPERPRSSRSS